MVALIHPKAMPVILTTPEKCDVLMSTPALRRQRPLPDEMLGVVATGEKQNPPPAAPEMAPA